MAQRKIFPNAEKYISFRKKLIHIYIYIYTYNCVCVYIYIKNTHLTCMSANAGKIKTDQNRKLKFFLITIFFNVKIIVYRHLKT